MYEKIEMTREFFEDGVKTLFDMEDKLNGLFKLVEIKDEEYSYRNKRYITGIFQSLIYSEYKVKVEVCVNYGQLIYNDERNWQNIIVDGGNSWYKEDLFVNELTCGLTQYICKKKNDCEQAIKKIKKLDSYDPDWFDGWEEEGDE